jgi:hypothetical protein
MNARCSTDVATSETQGAARVAELGLRCDAIRMKATRRSVCSAMCAVVASAALASVASSQHQNWIRQIGTSSSDAVYAATPDGSGGVYVCGGTDGNLGGPSAGWYDFWLARYDGAGSQTWIRQFGSSAIDQSFAAASDGAGGVYVSGVTEGSLNGPNAGGRDVWLAHYDPTGNRSWIRQFGTNRDDIVYAAVPDGSGGVFLTGSTASSLGGSSAGGHDVWVARHTSVGNQIWIRQFGSGVDDVAFAAASDGSGGVFVSGYTQGSLGGPAPTLFTSWLARYDGAGNQIWLRQPGMGRVDFTQAAAPDGSGGVFVSGRTWTPSGNDDVWLARHDGAGNQIWFRSFGSILFDGAYAAASDGSGGVYISGVTRFGFAAPHAGAFDVLVAHYDGAGNRTWMRQFGTFGEDHSFAAAPDDSGGVFVCGTTPGSLAGPSAGGADAWLARYEGLATRYCTPAVPNSTGQPAALTATGNNFVQFNDVTLEASLLPLSTFGYFMTSRAPGSSPNVGGSQGIPCLGGAIGRFVGPGQVQSSGTTGSFSLFVDLTAIPTPVGPVSVLPGETWSFQAWYRDTNPSSTSNFTDAVSVNFH